MQARCEYFFAHKGLHFLLRKKNRNTRLFTCAQNAHDLTASGIVEAADLKGFKQIFSFLEQRNYFVRGCIGYKRVKIVHFCVFPREMVIFT